MKASLVFLGTGASMGIPVVGCCCRVCQSKDPQNRRFRSSGLLKLASRRFVLDIGPDYRMQALQFSIDRIDGVLITHPHYDHIAGLDELRVYYLHERKKVPCLLSASALEHLQRYRSNSFERGSETHIDFQVIAAPFATTSFIGESWKTMSYEQKGMEVTGFRWGDFAYVMDVKSYTEQLYSALQGVKVLVMSALRQTSSPSHLSLEEAIDFSQKIGAEQTWFSHVAHELDHENTQRILPKGIQLAYDGLEIDIS